ncbi:MAG: DNA-processing protein DprA [Patescibacteria group bacterium]
MLQIKKLSPGQFPSALREIPQPPDELWIRGELPDENENTFLAVVGSRKYSRYGRDVCEKLISGLQGHKVVIVSGLALGIDGIAHRAALDANLKTIAIPGSGLDPSVIYPRMHAALAEEIVENGGALISEFPPDFRATDWSFPKRNRLMAGFSKAVLIVEAEEKSGTLITARMALDYNRDVFAVPGDIFSPNASGANRLIRQGATPITRSEELLLALGFEVGENRERALGELAGATEPEKKLWSILTEPMARDEIFHQSRMSVQEFNAVLSLLEIKGLITEELGEIRRNS